MHQSPKRKIVCISPLMALAIVLGGCVTADPMMLPSGQQGISVECGGTINSWPACYKKAAEVCPQGYDVIKESRESAREGGIYKDDDGDLFGTSSDTIDRWLLISCK